MTESIPSSSKSRSSRPLWLMLGGLILAWAALWGWRNIAGAEDLVPWRADAAAVLDAAGAAEGAGGSDRPVLLNFTADWCPPCQSMKAEVYADAGFAAWLDSRVVPVKVDLTAPGAAEESLAMRYGIEYIPTLVLVGRGGEELGRVGGFVPADELRASLTEMLDAAPGTDDVAGAGFPGAVEPSARGLRG